MIGDNDTYTSPIRPNNEAYNVDDYLKDTSRDAYDDLVMGDNEFEQWVQAPEEEEKVEAPLKKKVALTVKTPTKSEVEDHEKTHLPFRTWCKACVKGRGVSSPHMKVERDDPKASVISIDYCFPRSGVTILGAKDSLTGATASIWVPKKGGSIDWIVKHLCNMIDYEWGKTKIIFKSDGEEGILDVKRLVSKVRTHPTVFEKSMTGDHQGNGLAENMIREIEGMIRTWRNHLEQKYGMKIEATNPIFPWMVRYAGEVITRFKKGPDGMTAYERLKDGKKSRTRGAQLGERVMFMPANDAKNKKDKLDDVYDEGVWVGTSNADGSSILLTPDGPRVSRSIRQLPDGEKYDGAFLMSVRGTPWQIAGHVLVDEPEEKKTDIEESAIPERAPEEVPMPEPMIEVMPARMRILQKDLHIHGYTAGCIGCRQVLTGVKKIQAHTELCRARMYPLMRAAEGSKSRAEEAEQKKQDWDRRASEIEAQESVKRRKTGR